jgi:hypothetical protein
MSAPDQDPTNSRVRVVVFDTETTALKGVAVQVGIGYYDSAGDLVWRQNVFLQLPLGHSIEPGAQAVHGIDELMLSKNGLRSEDVLGFLHDFATVCEQVLKNGGTIVAHNAMFDCAVLQRTFDAHLAHVRFELAQQEGGGVAGRTRGALARFSNLSDLAAAAADPAANPFTNFHEKVFCTMLRSKHLVNAKDKRDRIKNPRNDELYQFLHGSPPVGKLHDASFDVDVTASSYHRGIERGWWKIGEVVVR